MAKKKARKKTSKELIAQAKKLLKRHKVMDQMQTITTKFVEDMNRCERDESLLAGIALGYTEGLFAGHKLAKPKFWE